MESEPCGFVIISAKNCIPHDAHLFGGLSLTPVSGSERTNSHLLKRLVEGKPGRQCATPVHVVKSVETLIILVNASNSCWVVRVSN